METLCEWKRNFRSNLLEREKWSTTEGRPSVPEKFLLEPRVPFAFQPVGPEILAKC